MRQSPDGTAVGARRWPIEVKKMPTDGRAHELIIPCITLILRYYQRKGRLKCKGKRRNTSYRDALGMAPLDGVAGTSRTSAQV